MSHGAQPQPGWLVAGLFAALGLVMAVVASLSRSTQEAVLTEGGPIETLSAIGYVVVAGLLVALMVREGRARAWPLVGLLLVMGARELDLDKRPFTEGLLKSRQYLGDAVPLAERLASLALLAGIVVLLVLAVRRYGRRTLRGVASLRPAPLLVATGLALAVVTKAIDGLDRKLAPFGISVGEPAMRLVGLVEEIGELGIPLAFTLAIPLVAADHARSDTAGRHRTST